MLHITNSMSAILKKKKRKKKKEGKKQTDMTTWLLHFIIEIFVLPLQNRHTLLSSLHPGRSGISRRREEAMSAESNSMCFLIGLHCSPTFILFILKQSPVLYCLHVSVVKVDNMPIYKCYECNVGIIGGFPKYM